MAGVYIQPTSLDATQLFFRYTNNKATNPRTWNRKIQRGG